MFGLFFFSSGASGGKNKHQQDKHSPKLSHDAFVLLHFCFPLPFFSHFEANKK
jgi:hypothetical protein